MTDDEYYNNLLDFYNDMLISMIDDDKSDDFNKDCDKDCNTNRKFIFQTVDGKMSLIYTCGEKDGKCGPIIQIDLPTRINYDDEYDFLYNKINDNIDYEILKRYINIDTEKYDKENQMYNKRFEDLKNLLKNLNDLSVKKDLCKKNNEEIENFKKENYVL
jgi:hypothetical protein